MSQMKNQKMARLVGCCYGVFLLATQAAAQATYVHSLISAAPAMPAPPVYPFPAFKQCFDQSYIP